MARKKTMVTETAPIEETIVSFKGFDKDLKCHGFQYEIGQPYTHDGPVKACDSGFHACENPLRVFAYYPPKNGNRYATATQVGPFSKQDDTKVASAVITINAELRVPDIIKASLKWAFARADKAVASGYSSTGAASGDSSTGAASGNSSKAVVTGKHSCALSGGKEGCVKGIGGCALFLVYRHPKTMEIIYAWSGIVGKDGIKPDVWYSLDASGNPIEVS